VSFFGFFDGRDDFEAFVEIVEILKRLDFKSMCNAPFLKVLLYTVDMEVPKRPT